MDNCAGQSRSGGLEGNSIGIVTCLGDDSPTLKMSIALATSGLILELILTGFQVTALKLDSKILGVGTFGG